jgi:hypothetical protein
MDEGYWNPINNSVQILGASHPNSGPGQQFGVQCFVQYTESNNTWRNLTVPDTSGASGTAAHEYNHSAIDRAGNFYHRRYYSSTIRKYTWSDCTPWGNNTFQVAGALEYFPERNSLVFLDGDWGVWELSLASGNCTGTWVQRASTRGGGFSPQLIGLFAYHNQSRYSARCLCIIMGGGNGSRKLYRFNANGTFAAIADAPIAIAIPQGGAGTIFTVDPVSGLILVWNYSRGRRDRNRRSADLELWCYHVRTGRQFVGWERLPLPARGWIRLTHATTAV